MKARLRRIGAVAVLTLRTAARSRLLVSLFLLLAVATLGLPFTLRGDGTPVGQLRILLYYTLGLGVALLAAATIGHAGGSIARDIAAKSVQMVVTKPLHRWELWAGRWLGLLALNAMLLTACAATVWCAVMLYPKVARLSDAERATVQDTILVSRLSIPPEPDPLFQKELERRYEQVHGGHDHGHADEARGRAELAATLRSAWAVLPAGRSRRWTFRLRGGTPKGAATWLRVRLTPSVIGRRPVRGRWTVTDDAGRERHRHDVDGVLGHELMIALPPGSLDEGGELRVRLDNASRDQSAPFYFVPENELELLVRCGTFSGNYWRGVLLMFAGLATLAALGLSAGAIFSAPVAVFTATAIVIMALATHYFAFASAPEQMRYVDSHDHGPPSTASRIGRRLSDTLYVVVAPAFRFQVLGPLSDGVRITWTETATGLGVLLVGYPLALGALAGWRLSRRELALPE